MIAAAKTPPQLLREKQPVTVHLARALRLSRYHVYGLINPQNYPDAIPAGMFDTRSDVAERVAAFIGLPIDAVRDFYARAKEVA